MAECHYGRIQDCIVDNLWYNETQVKMTCKNLVQYRYSLMINGIFNTLAPHLFCGCKIKEIQLYKYLSLSGL